jgi:hypothetical protein
MDASLRPDDTTMADEIAYASATSRDPLPIVLKAALTHIERGERDLRGAEGHFTSAALRFKELKDRVKAGEAGKVSWADFCAQHIPQLSQRTVDGYIYMVELCRSWEFEGTRSEKVWHAWLKNRSNMPKAVREAADEAERAKRMGDGPYHFWCKATGREDNAKSRAEWANMGRKPEANTADAKPTSSAKPQRDPEARKAQNAKAQANRRAKSSTIREANGGKASKPRQAKETTEQYRRLARLATVLDAGQLQIINEMIEERRPGTEAKANKECR